MINVAVESIIFGSEDSHLPQFSPVELHLASESITIRDLIYRTVQQQIQYHLEAKKEEVGIVQGMLRRQYLTNQDIEQQSKQGSIQFRNEKPARVPVIDIDAEYRRALRGFEASVYKLIIDGETMDDLDETVVLKPESNIIFIRLTPLVGG